MSRVQFTVVLVVIGMGWAAPGVAQISSVRVSTDWPIPVPDVTTYRTIFECLAAASRTAMTAPENLVARDTMPVSVYTGLEKIPRVVQDVARQCSAKFDPDSVALADYQSVIELYLQAGREAEARRVAQRRLAAAAGEVKRRQPDLEDPEIRNVDRAVRERAQILRTLALTFLGTRPVHLALALPYVLEMRELGRASPWSERLRVTVALFNAANAANDTALARQSAQWILALPGQLTEAARRSPEYQSATDLILAARRYGMRSVERDSLRKSTAAYITLQQSFRREIFGSMDDRIGRTAPPVEGEFWFPSTQAQGVPAPGRVTVILAEGLAEWASRDLGAMFRRWKGRFPNIDIVYAARTQGFFMDVEPPLPDVEAQYRRREVQDYYGYPALVVVSNTPFWRLEDPDRRRMNKATANQLNYGDRLWLIDQAGTIIYYGEPSAAHEDDFTELIDVLMSRP